MTRRTLALVAALGVLAAGSACVKKNEDKLNLENLLDESAHTSGVFRYSDTTPSSPLETGVASTVRGLVEDDFRFKARLSIDATDVLDEVVNDDALAVRFLDPKYVAAFTGKGGDAATRTALGGRFWVYDPSGAPPIGDAAVSGDVLGLDPIVDSLSVTDYVKDAIAQSLYIRKFNAEEIDYRPAEDPFPQPARGSGVVRWDLIPPKLPRADALDTTGQANAALAKIADFRKMSVYVQHGRVVQIREQIAAKFDLLDEFHRYIDRLLDKTGDRNSARAKAQIKKIENDPAALEAVLSLALNQILASSGQDLIRFRTMTYEFSRQGEKVHADLPTGPEVKSGKLDFFGVNNALATRQGNAANSTSSTTTTPSTTTTVAP